MRLPLLVLSGVPPNPRPRPAAPVSPAPRANIDPHRLQQCLTALVDNALLYSDGPVTLAASSGPAGELVLHVIDRGPGTAGLASPHPGGGADFQLLLPGLG